jgi:predicted DCC family thiol-disulfide oxidoreductase YuxK
MSDVPAEHTTRPVLLFDGVCNFCNGSIQFIVDHERSSELVFAPLQSEIGAKLVERVFDAEEARLLRGANGSPDSLVLIEGGRGHVRSAAALRVTHWLRAPWRWLGLFVLVPRPLRDLVYRWIVRNRYRWFGRTETCRIPTPALRARFLG